MDEQKRGENEASDRGSKDSAGWKIMKIRMREERRGRTVVESFGWTTYS